LSLGQTLRGRLLSLRFAARSPEDWVRIGGRDEDIPLNRVLNHFYDPHYDVSLTFSLGGAKAPDWALEDAGDLAGQNHSYKDARQAFYDGLTLASRTSRERELGHTFYALGHVIHLIQDLTVAEHTRDDLHLFIGSDASLYEKYLKNKTDLFDLTAAQAPVAIRARDLWVNAQGTGIAKFTNANFVSADTNFTELRTGAQAERYPSPVLDLARVDTAPTGTCRDGADPPASVTPVVFYGNSMSDPVTSQLLQNPRMTAASLFDSYLVARAKPPIFSLNCFTVDAAAEILLPRASAHSAALLDFFFRGRLGAIVGGNAFRIVNRTSDAQRWEAMDGVFALYSDTAGGTRQSLGTWTLALQPDEMTRPLAVATPPDDATACMLVFRGRLGEEVDAVTGQQLTACPTPTTLAQPTPVEWQPSWGGGSYGCPADQWHYQLEVCCSPNSPPSLVGGCARNLQEAISGCQSVMPWFLNCRLPQ
ncbi:MAG: hypothetical protein ACRELA_17350, partial [Candidatus Rokuibacteriota bacterium]